MMKYLVLTLTAILLWGCLREDVAGFGSETTSGNLEVALVDQGGSSGPGIQARLRSADYLAVEKSLQFSSAVQSGPDGVVRFSGVPFGSYTIELLDDSSGAVIQNLNFYADTLIHNIRMQKLGGIKGRVDTTYFPDGVALKAGIRGLERVTDVGSDGEFQFTGLAPSRYQIKIHSNQAEQTGEIEFDAMVEEGKITSLKKQALPIGFRNDSLRVFNYLSKQGVLGLRPFETFVGSGKQRIRWLHLEELGMESIHPSLASLDFIHHITLSDNPLSEIPSGLANLDLRGLDLDGTNLDSIPRFLTQIPWLGRLDISRTRIDSLPGHLKEMKNLSSLFAGGLGLQKVPEVILEMTWLNYLHLNANEIDTLPDNFGVLSELSTLRLQHNQLQSLPASFANCTKMQQLFLNHNQLNQFPNQLLKFENLEFLQLGNNNIPSLPSQIGNLGRLEVLGVAKNQIQILPPTLLSLTRLKSFGYERNSICTVDQEMIQWLEQFDTYNKDRQNGC